MHWLVSSILQKAAEGAAKVAADEYAQKIDKQKVQAANGYRCPVCLKKVKVHYANGIAECKKGHRWQYGAYYNLNDTLQY